MSSSPIPQPLLMPQAEAAEYLGVSVRTVRRYIATGRLTAYRMGPHLIRVNVEELNRLLRPIPTAGASRPPAA